MTDEEQQTITIDGPALLHFWAAQAKTEAARADYERASQALSNRKIWERFFEIQSQHDPLMQIIEDSGVDADSNYAQTLRDLMVTAARYVMTGRTTP